MIQKPKPMRHRHRAMRIELMDVEWETALGPAVEAQPRGPLQPTAQFMAQIWEIVDSIEKGGGIASYGVDCTTR